MAVLMIGYDLHEGQDYKNLIDAIKALGSWWHCLDSTWLISTTHSTTTVRDSLRNHIRSDDKLLVISYGGAAAWYGFDGDCQNWLKNNL